MATEWQDSELRNLFKQQKQADSRHTPDFDKMWENAVEQSEQKRPRKWRFSLVAAGLLLTLNIGVWQLTQHNKSEAIQELSNLSKWQSPTKTLLPATLVNNHKENTTKQQAGIYSVKNISNWQAPSDGLLPKSQSMYY